jgi:hemerythrin
MNLIIYVNDHFEEERALFDLEGNREILKGDYYHDKITERIEGYLQALDDFKIYTEEVETEWIDSTHQHYELLEFYKE